MAEVQSSKKPVGRPKKAVAPAPVKSAAPDKPKAVVKALAPAPAKKAPAKRAVAKKIAPIVARPVKPAAAPAVAKPAAKIAVAAPVAQAIPAKPIEVKPVIKTEPKTVTAPALPVIVKEKTMNDTVAKVQETIKQSTEEATAKATAFFNDANGRAKDAFAKSQKGVEELVEFSKGNLEAIAASGRIAAKGAEDIAKYSAEYGRATIEKANATAKQFAAVKSPTEFFQLQGDVAKQTLDAVVAEGSKFTESYLKLLGEVFQPIQNRYAVAVEKVKSSVAA